MSKDTYLFLISLRDKLSEFFPMTFPSEIKKLSEIISEYERSEEIRDDMLETLSESM